MRMIIDVRDAFAEAETHGLRVTSRRVKLYTKDFEEDGIIYSVPPRRFLVNHKDR